MNQREERRLAPETERAIGVMLANFWPNKDSNFKLVISAYREEMQPFNDGAIQSVAKKYLNGSCGRANKTFAPSLAEFTDAVRKENGFWNGTQRRPLQTKPKQIAYQGDPDRETKHERMRRIGREVMADWDREHGYDRERDSVNRTPLFHERMAEMRRRVSGNIAGAVPVKERKKA